MSAFDAAWAVLKGVGKEQTRLPQFYGPSDLEDYYEHRHRQDVIEDIKRRQNDRRPRPVPHRVLHTKEADTGRHEFTLVDENGRELSTTRAPDYGHLLTDIVSSTPSEHQRKKYYRTLLNSLIQGGFEVESMSRNQNSHPFHRNFQSTLPPNTSFSDITTEKFGRRTPSAEGRYFRYNRTPVDSPPGYGDLRQFHGGHVPLVKVEDRRDKEMEVWSQKILDEEAPMIDRKDRRAVLPFTPILSQDGRLFFQQPLDILSGSPPQYIQPSGFLSEGNYPNYLHESMDEKYLRRARQLALGAAAEVNPENKAAYRARLGLDVNPEDNPD